MPCLSAMADEAPYLMARRQAHATSVRREQQAVERVLQDQSLLTSALRHQRLLYIGGRLSNNVTLRALVQAAHGEFISCCMVIDQRDINDLGQLLQRVDRVLCPLDLIDHDSLTLLRRLCTARQVPWLALRTSSVASFIAGILRAGREMPSA